MRYRAIGGAGGVCFLCAMEFALKARYDIGEPVWLMPFGLPAVPATVTEARYHREGDRQTCHIQRKTITLVGGWYYGVDLAEYEKVRFHELRLKKRPQRGDLTFRELLETIKEKPPA